MKRNGITPEGISCPPVQHNRGVIILHLTELNVTVTLDTVSANCMVERPTYIQGNGEPSLEIDSINEGDVKQLSDRQTLPMTWTRNKPKLQMTYLSNVTYLLTSKESSNYLAASIFASFYAGSSLFSKAVNWRQTDVTCLGLYLINTYLLISPVLSQNVVSTFGSGRVLVSKHTIRTLGSFTPLSRERERFEFLSELDSLEEVHKYLDLLISDVERIFETNEAFGYYLPFMVDADIRRVVLNNILVQLRVYRSCKTATKLGFEIGVSFSKLQALPGFPASDTDVNNAFVFAEGKSVTVPYGVRKFIPLGTKRVAFTGDPSVPSLSLTQLFVKKVSVRYSDGETVDILAPSVGCSVVVIENLNQGQWLQNLLTAPVGLRSSDDSDKYRKESGSTPTRSEGIPMKRSKSVSSVSDVGGVPSRSYSSEPFGEKVPLPVTGWWFHFDGKEFRRVGLAK